MTKVYCVFKREFIGESFDDYPMYSSNIIECFTSKDSAENYCDQFSKDVDEDEEGLLCYIVEMEVK